MLSHIMVEASNPTPIEVKKRPDWQTVYLTECPADVFFLYETVYVYGGSYQRGKTWELEFADCIAAYRDILGGFEIWQSVPPKDLLFNGTASYFFVPTFLVQLQQTRYESRRFTQPQHQMALHVGALSLDIKCHLLTHSSYCEAVGFNPHDIELTTEEVDEILEFLHLEGDSQESIDAGTPKQRLAELFLNASRSWRLA